jgi:hypothetical protein
MRDYPDAGGLTARPGVSTETFAVTCYSAFDRFFALFDGCAGRNTRKSS